MTSSVTLYAPGRGDERTHIALVWRDGTRVIVDPVTATPAWIFADEVATRYQNRGIRVLRRPLTDLDPINGEVS